MSIKPLPGQLDLFAPEPRTADEAQAAAASRRSDADAPERPTVPPKSEAIETPDRCQWGHCQQQATYKYRHTGEEFCQVHIMWVQLTTVPRPRRRKER